MNILIVFSLFCNKLIHVFYKMNQLNSTKTTGARLKAIYYASTSCSSKWLSCILLMIADWWSLISLQFCQLMSWIRCIFLFKQGKLNWLNWAIWICTFCCGARQLYFLGARHSWWVTNWTFLAIRFLHPIYFSYLFVFVPVVRSKIVHLKISNTDSHSVMF